MIMPSHFHWNVEAGKKYPNHKRKFWMQRFDPACRQAGMKL
jgi:hypothetical protein